MNRLITIITVAAISVHALWGCCHHQLENVAGTAAEHSVCFHNGHSHTSHGVQQDCSTNSEGNRHPPCNDEDCCCRLKCQWLTSPTGRDLAQPGISAQAFTTIDLASAQSAGEVSLNGTKATLDSICAHPVRMHLALNVLLI